MSFLRHRLLPSSADRSSKKPSDEIDYPPIAPLGGKRGPGYAVVSSDQLNRLNSKSSPKGTKRRNAWIFILGGIFGVAMAIMFASNERIIDISGLADFNLDSIIDVLPAGLVKDAQDLQVGHLVLCRGLATAAQISANSTQLGSCGETHIPCRREL